jgi:aryl-alcohol dehydrogenase-like predicted oxidoreductase
VRRPWVDPPHRAFRGGHDGDNATELAWLLRRSPVILPIPGTRSIEHLRENLAALDLA